MKQIEIVKSDGKIIRGELFEPAFIIPDDAKRRMQKGGVWSKNKRII